MHARCFDIITDALTNARLRRQESVRKLENREAEPRNMVAEREREREREEEKESVDRGKLVLKKIKNTNLA